MRGPRPLVVSQSVRCSYCAGDGLTGYPDGDACAKCEGRGYFLPALDREPETLEEAFGALDIAQRRLVRAIGGTLFEDVPEFWSHFPRWFQYLICAVFFIASVAALVWAGEPRP